MTRGGRRHPVAWVTACASLTLLLVSCTPPPSTTPSTTTSAATTTTAAPEARDLAAILRGNGSVAIVDATGTVITTLNAQGVRRFRQPVWIDDDVIVATETEAAGPHELVAISISDGELWRVPLGTPPFYYAPNRPLADPRETTSLRNAPDGDGLIAELVVDGDVVEFDRRSPFYTAWSPSGDAIAIHAGTELFIRDGSVDRSLDDSPAIYQAPLWLNAGIVGVRAVDGQSRVTVWKDGEPPRDLAVVDGPVLLVGSGGRVVFQSNGSEGGGVRTALRMQAEPPNAGSDLLAVDVESGVLSAVTSERTLLYQLSPDGHTLAYVTVDAGDPLTLAWNTWENGRSTRRASFAPSLTWIREVVPFFDQYAQSASVWAASGRTFAYPAIEDGEPIVVIQSIDSGESVTITDAEWVAWSR